MEELKIGNVVVEKPTITDNMRILQALDCLCGKGSGLCNNCEFFTGNGFEECIRNVSIAAIDLIRHLQSENKTQRKIIEYRDSIDDRNAELQRQVDELKEERENMQAEIIQLNEDVLDISEKYRTEKINSMNAVKDTAKEILQRGQYCMPSGLKDFIAERYGVEVE